MQYGNHYDVHMCSISAAGCCPVRAWLPGQIYQDSIDHSCAAQSLAAYRCQLCKDDYKVLVYTTYSLLISTEILLNIYMHMPPD